MTGTVLEEGLRGAGGYLLNGAQERVMQQYDPKGERATRDVVSRAMYTEMRKGKTTPHGGLYIAMAHLGPEVVRKAFKGMVERCADCGFDLAGGLVNGCATRISAPRTGRRSTPPSRFASRLSTGNPRSALKASGKSSTT
jgi:hypothetical protein